MFIQEIINIIKNNELQLNNNYFFGNYGDYLRCGNSYIKLLSEEFPIHSDINNNSIIINYNNKKYKIIYINKFNEIHWLILLI
jgi:hypothetical protein